MDGFEKNNFDEQEQNNESENIQLDDDDMVIWDDESAEYETKQNIKSSREKISKGKVVVASIMALALFLGTAVGFSLPEFLKRNKADILTGYVPENNQPVQNTLSSNANITTGKELTTQEVAALVGPAVVGIENIATSNYYYYEQLATQGTGSGVLISEDGYIVTNYHVVEGSAKIKITLSTGKEFEAKVIGADEDSDLAVVKIDGNGFPYAKFGDSSKVMVGDKAIAIGNPLGTELMGTVTQGIISAVNRTVQVDNRTMTLLQTDAAINSGNSGGALINAYGEIIGINSVKMAASGVEGLGFAIPSNTVSSVVSDLKEYGYVKGKLSIGIAGQNITAKMANYYDLPMGFFIHEVYYGSGAEKAGLMPGDIIVKCDGVLIETIDDINNIKKTHKVGDIMKIQAVRNGKNKSFDVVLQEERPETAW